MQCSTRVAGTYPQHIALGRQGTVESGVMAQPTILITGSSGFLGQAIAQALIGRYAVIGLDMVQPKQPIHGMATIQTDLTSDASVAKTMQAVRERAGDRITSVIHLAAYYDTTGEDNPKYGAVTVKGTLRLLEALKALRTDQFIFSSTLLVHAPVPKRESRSTRIRRSILPGPTRSRNSRLSAWSLCIADQSNP